MFTVLTIVMILVAWRLRDGAERKDRHDEMALPLVRPLHGREDMRLITYLLFAILIMLGIIADLLVFGYSGPIS
jgi:hypothetical protein